MIQQKVEIRFQKGEAVRFISHHDLMRAFARALRRANLPVRLTEGFNPRPRLVFPVALEVGVASLDEVAEIELTQWLEVQEVFARLSSVLPPGLKVTAVTELPPRRQGRIPVRLLYRIHLREAGLQADPAAARKLLDQSSLPLARARENRVQQVDLRPALLEINLEPDGNLLVAVKPDPKGSARPLEVLSLLLNQPVAALKHVRVTKLSMEMNAPK